MKTLAAILVLASIGVCGQIYTNEYLNAKYEAPAGWTITNIDTAQDGSVTFFSQGAGYQAVFIEFKKFSTHSEADLYSRAAAFDFNMAFFKKFPSTTAPVMSYIADTTFAPFRYCNLNMRELDKNKISAVWSSSFSYYTQVQWLLTSIDDYDANVSLYSSSWLGVSFKSIVSSSAKSSASTKTQFQLKSDFLDLLGRAHLTPSTITIPREISRPVH